MSDGVTTEAGRALQRPLSDAEAAVFDEWFGPASDGVSTAIRRAIRDGLVREAVEDERRRLYEEVLTEDALAAKLTRIRGAHNNADYETEEGEPCGWCRLAAEQARAAVFALLAPPAENPGCPECGLVGAHNERCASQWSAPAEKEQT